MPDAAPEEKREEKVSRFQKFVTTYSTFMSSFVIGAAGLVATTIYQSKQQDIGRRQAEAQIDVASKQAENQWKIERAEILSKNLSVLSTTRDDTTDQRYGVLLSLSRGKIIDPELAVAYALELGNHNPDYMRTVLANVDAKEYIQLERAYQLTCDQRYGVARDVPLCRNQAFVPRSEAIAALVSDELLAGNKAPLRLLDDEPRLQAAIQKRVELFEPYLQALYDRRQLRDIEAFEAHGAGARLVSSLCLAADKSGELLSADEVEERDRFHHERQRWLTSYLVGKSCDPECRGRVSEVMLNDLAASGGAFDDALAALLLRPDPENNQVESRLHARLLWCRVAPDAEARLRDKVMVPLATAAMHGAPKAPVTERLDDLLDLLALIPEPADGTPEKAAWTALLDGVRTGKPDLYKRRYLARRDEADRQRKSPPLALKGASFCGAPALEQAATATDTTD